MKIEPIRKFSATLWATIITTMLLSSTLAFMTLAQCYSKYQLKEHENSGFRKGYLTPSGLCQKQSVCPISKDSFRDEQLLHEYKNEHEHLTNSLWAFRTLMDICIILVGGLFLITGYKFSFIFIKNLIKDEEFEGDVKRPFLSYFVPLYVGSSLVPLILGYVAGFIIFKVSGVHGGDGTPMPGPELSIVLHHLAFSCGLTLIVGCLVALGFFIDIQNAWLTASGQTTSGEHKKLSLDERFNAGGSSYYLTFGLFGLFIWSICIGIVSSKYLSGMRPGTSEFMTSDVFTYYQLAPEYLGKLLAISLAAAASQIAVFWLLKKVVDRIRRSRVVEKPDHRAQRIMLLVIPPLVCMSLAGLFLKFLGLFFKELGSTTIFDDLSLILMLALPSALMSPLVILMSVSETVPKRSRQPFTDAMRASGLYIYHVLRMNKALTVISIVFTLYFIVSWNPANVQHSTIASFFSFGLGLWLLPIIHSMMSFEEVCQASYSKYLRQSFKRFGNHFVIGGFGDLGQRVAREVAKKAFLDDKFGVRRFLDGADIIMPDGRLRKLWCGMVVIDKDRTRFHFITKLDNGMEAGVAIFRVSAESDASEIFVPAIVGNVEENDTMNAVKIRRAKFFACLAREDSAPFLTVQAITRMIDDFNLVPVAQPSLLARLIGSEDELDDRKPGKTDQRPPVCALTTANQPQYDSILKNVFNKSLPVHVLNTSYLESMQFAGRIYATYKKFRRYRKDPITGVHFSEVNQIPRILLIGKGIQMLHATEMFFRCLSRQELKEFQNQLEPMKFVILSDFDDIRDFCNGSIELPGTKLSFGDIRIEDPEHKDRNIYSYRHVNPNWTAINQSNNVLPCLYLSGFVRTPDLEKCCVPIVDNIAIPLLFSSASDFAPMIDALDRVKPDIIGLSDFSYVDQLVALGNTIAAIQRKRNVWEDSMLPMPDILVCRENGPRGGGIRRKVNRMLAEYALTMRNSIDPTGKHRGRLAQYDPDKPTREGLQIDYINTYPAQPEFASMSELYKEKEQRIADKVNDVVVDVLDELVSRICTLADTALPKSWEPEARIELDLCLPEKPGVIAGFWAQILKNRQVLKYNEDANVPFFNLLHIEENLDQMESPDDERRFIAKSYAFLGHRDLTTGSGQAKLDDRCGHCNKCKGRSFTIVGHGIGGRDSAAVQQLRAAISESVPQITQECEITSDDCPRSLYCGLSDISTCLEGETEGNSFSLHGRFRQWDEPELSFAEPSDCGTKAQESGDAVTEETPYAHLEFGGRDVPGAACLALNTLLFQIIANSSPVPSFVDTLDVKFLSDYQCSSEDQFRMLMFCHVLKPGKVTRTNHRDEPVSPMGLDTLLIKPVTYRSQWLEYANNLKSFLEVHDNQPWHMQTVRSDLTGRAMEIRLVRDSRVRKELL